MAHKHHLPQRHGRHPLDPFSMLQGQIDRVFEDFGGFGLRHADSGAAPVVDMREADKAFDIEAELPGVDKADIDLRVTHDHITIRADKKHEREEDKDDYHLVERQFGSMQRVLAFPCDVDTSKIDASFKDGVLRVHVPKAPEAQSRETKIKLS